VAEASKSPADQAIGHLNAAAGLLRKAYDHPHHNPRLEQIEQILTGVTALVQELPQAELQRADYAGRLLEQYKNRQLPAHLPDHAELLLSQELARAGQ